MHAGSYAASPWSRVAQAARGSRPVVHARGIEAVRSIRAGGGTSTLGASAVASLRARSIGRPWRRTARPEQQLICDHPTAFIRLAMAGRGWGKGFSITNALAEWSTKQRGDWCAIAPTLGDARKILTESESGLLVALGDEVAEYNKSSLIIYLRNGSRIILASAERPDRLRGLNLSGGIVDELASFPVGTVRELWDKALLPAVRKGEHPKLAIATTPRRSSPILKELIKRSDDGDPTVMIIRGTTFDNEANLSGAFLDQMRQRYLGTTTGRQELLGELLADVEGALLTSDVLDDTRVLAAHLPELRHIAIGVDPAVSATENSDLTGLIAVGIGGPPVGDWKGKEALVEGEHLYFLNDWSLRAVPERWAARALDMAELWDAETITAERNQGGDMVETMIKMVARAEQRHLPHIKPVWASREKYIRAEPVAGVWQQRRAHVLGSMPGLEDGWVSWVPGDKKSPDELDASVHAGVGLMPQLGIKPSSQIKVLAG